MTSENNSRSSIWGRLEKVHVKGPWNEHCAYSCLDGHTVLVYNGLSHVGEDCLVRLKKSFCDGEYYLSSFVSSNPPKDFEPMEQDEYVLLGVWEERMRNGLNDYPTLEEINEFYDPGSLGGGVIYLSKGSNRKEGRVSIGPFGEPFVFHRTISGIVQGKLPDPDLSSRLILVESKKDFKRIENILFLEGLAGVSIDPLK